jgi:hypothetical protein
MYITGLLLGVNPLEGFSKRGATETRPVVSR